MIVCFPVQNNDGMKSDVYNHFGSAPEFVLVDTSDNTVTSIKNADRIHAKGACNPIMALGSRRVDAVVVGGIGAGALGKLNQIGIKVYRAEQNSIAVNLESLAAGRLPEYSPGFICSGHSIGGSCSH